MNMTAEELFLSKYGNEITAKDSWVIRFANEHAESLAKERAVEFNMRGITRFENDGMEELYNKAYDTFLAEKRKEGAECQHENAFPPFNDMKDKMKMYCPDCKQSF